MCGDQAIEVVDRAQAEGDLGHRSEIFERNRFTAASLHAPTDGAIQRARDPVQHLGHRSAGYGLMRDEGGEPDRSGQCTP